MLVISTNLSSESLIIFTKNLQIQLIDCRETLRQLRQANQQDRIANFELYAQYRNFYFDAYRLYQACANLKVNLYKEHNQYIVTY